LTLEELQQAIADERARIEQAQGAIREANEDIFRAEARIVALEAAANLFEHEHDSDLHTPRGSASNKHMPALAHKTTTPKRMGRPFKTNHPLAAWIAKNGTAEALAEKLAAKTKEDCSASAVRSWYLPSPHGRPCPEVFQAILEKAPYNIPRSAWRNRPSR
jgi:hypothetical protein